MLKYKPVLTDIVLGAKSGTAFLSLSLVIIISFMVFLFFVTLGAFSFFFDPYEKQSGLCDECSSVS